MWFEGLFRVKGSKKESGKQEWPIDLETKLCGLILWGAAWLVHFREWGGWQLETQPPIPSHLTGDVDHWAAYFFSLNFSLTKHKRRLFDLTSCDLMALFSLAFCLRRPIKGAGGGRGVLNTAMTDGFIFLTRKQTLTGHSQVTQRQDIAEWWQSPLSRTGWPLCELSTWGQQNWSLLVSRSTANFWFSYSPVGKLHGPAHFPYRQC